MAKIVKRFEVGAPPERVFASISVPENWPQWASFVKRASSNGSKTHWIYEMAGMKVMSDTEITEVQENRLYEFRQVGGFLKQGGTRLEIEPTEGGSTITWTTQYEPPYSYLGKLADKLKMGKRFEEAIDESLRNLKKILER